MDKLHYSKWHDSQMDYINLVKAECDYRIEQISQTATKRERVLRNRLATEKDEKIIRMKQSELDRLNGELERQKKSLEETVSKADIHTMLLVKGVLKVE